MIELIGMFLIWIAVALENVKTYVFLRWLFQVVIISLGIFLITFNLEKRKINLPEKISQVDSNDNLKGYYRNNTLFIEFKH